MLLYIVPLYYHLLSSIIIIKYPLVKYLFPRSYGL